ncbi:allergen Tab y 5.0101 [Drosophila mojavensis]|uniref:SCP domain-containing protein n=1 Tax=Drosophila mojavensis TaxID=7230 RepID=B4KW04_DROMO|nr:allergen Tab y 5.0101 [Drosophila mojavensis]EDW19555.1 uncharacterized protein Dmoj_GI11460 [Drosophila mojavensis]
MQRMKKLLVLWLVLCWNECLAIDFCNMTECNGLRHLGCENDLTFHESCLRTRILLNMQIYRDYLLKLHNKYREEVASGDIKGLPAAMHMPELIWHFKLALIAEYHVKRCSQDLNYCLAVSTFTNPALNYGMNWLDIEPIPNYSRSTNSEKLTVQTEVWMHQVYKLALGQNEVGEVSQIKNILNDHNKYVGCAAAEDFNREASRFVLVCYYNSQIDPASDLYTAGTFSEDHCADGVSEDYPHLCKTLPDEFD